MGTLCPHHGLPGPGRERNEGQWGPSLAVFRAKSQWVVDLRLRPDIWVVVGPVDAHQADDLLGDDASITHGNVLSAASGHGSDGWVQAEALLDAHGGEG